MALVTHGVNKIPNRITLANYSLTTQIVIINIFTAFLALVILIIFNFFLLISNKNLENHKKLINYQLTEITSYLSKTAIKRILTFDDSCNTVSKEQNREEARVGCQENNLLDKNYEDKPLQLDPTYTQQYIYSNYLNSSFIVKVFSENWIKFADTKDYYPAVEEVVIMDINSNMDAKTEININFYEHYQNFYFKFYNKLQKYLDEQKLKKLKNDNITIMETIKTKQSTSYMFKDQDSQFKSIFASPIIKEDKVHGVALIIAPLTYENNQSAYQSILLTNFFIFFISVMFFLSILFSKSIVAPIKLLSKITQLERDKSIDKKINIVYPNRKDEIGTLSHDIKSMSYDLKRRINEIEEFAADVSHELKNPLSGLKSSNDLLFTENLNEKNKNLLIKNMKQDIDRMNILISDISNYTLTQVEISEEAFEDLELKSFFYNFKNSYFNKNFILEIQNNTKEVYVRINKNKFIQVLHNLLDNSSSFVSLKSKVLIFMTIKNNECIIHLVDQGPGIHLDYKDKIFDRFYSDRNEKREAHTGLGLSIVRNIIESFGGKISLIKSAHKGFDGACFEIKLPLIR